MSVSPMQPLASSAGQKLLSGGVGAVAIVDADPGLTNAGKFWVAGKGVHEG
jgi:hypothetical protein